MMTVLEIRTHKCVLREIIKDLIQGLLSVLWCGLLGKTGYFNRHL